MEEEDKEESCAPHGKQETERDRREGGEKGEGMGEGR